MAFDPGESYVATRSSLFGVGGMVSVMVSGDSRWMVDEVDRRMRGWRSDNLVFEKIASAKCN